MPSNADAAERLREWLDIRESCGAFRVRFRIDDANHVDLDDADLRALLAAYEGAVAERDALRTRFRIYAEHREMCSSYQTHKCDCGFADAWYETFPEDKPFRTPTDQRSAGPDAQPARLTGDHHGA